MYYMDNLNAMKVREKEKCHHRKNDIQRANS